MPWPAPATSPPAFYNPAAYHAAMQYFHASRLLHQVSHNTLLWLVHFVISCFLLVEEDAFSIDWVISILLFDWMVKWMLTAYWSVYKSRRRIVARFVFPTEICDVLDATAPSSVTINLSTTTWYDFTASISSLTIRGHDPAASRWQHRAAIEPQQT